MVGRVLQADADGSWRVEYDDGDAEDLHVRPAGVQAPNIMHEDGGYVGGERSPLACKVVKKRKTARAKDQPTYVPFYGDIQRAWLDEGDEPFAHRLKFEVGNGLMMQGREQWLPHATISLQQMFHSEECTLRSCNVPGHTRILHHLLALNSVSNDCLPQLVFHFLPVHFSTRSHLDRLRFPILFNVRAVQRERALATWTQA